MVDKPAEKKAEQVKVPQGRSPAYPYVSLPEAITRTEQIRDAGATRSAMPPETFYKIWNIGAQSSGARQTLAALNHFGLVEYIGRGDDRKVKLSDLALKIVLDKQPDSAERRAAIAQAAVQPPIHKELFDRFGPLLPADVVLETYLTRDRGYNEAAANYLVGEYKSTLEFSGLNKPDNMPDLGADSQRDGGVGASERAPVIPDPPPVPQRKGQLMAGERELISGILGKDANFRLIVSGEIGVKEIEHLIRKLELDKGILGESGDDEESDHV